MWIKRNYVLFIRYYVCDVNITVDVPIKPHLKYFLNDEFGEYCKLSTTSPCARVLFGYLDVKNKAELPKLKTDQIYYKVQIPVRFFLRHKYSSISEEGVWELAEWFDRYFNRMMVEFVKSRLMLKNKREMAELLSKHSQNSLIQINGSIIDFLQLYRVTDEYMTLDTAKKRFFRNANNRGMLI